MKPDEHHLVLVDMPVAPKLHGRQPRQNTLVTDKGVQNKFFALLKDTNSLK